MKKNHQSSQFKTIRDEWYSILAADGFKDIEDVNSPLGLLKVWSSCPAEINSKDEYFQMANDFLEVCIFKNETERRIWEMHAEGLTMRQICGAISTYGYSLRNVHRVISKLRKMMLYRFEK